MMTDGDGDYCLSYSSASALHHLGDAKLPAQLVQDASTILLRRRFAFGKHTGIRAGGGVRALVVPQHAHSLRPYPRFVLCVGVSCFGVW